MVDILARSREMFKARGMPKSNIKVGRGSVSVSRTVETKSRGREAFTTDGERVYDDTHYRKNVELEERVRKSNATKSSNKGFTIDQDRAMAIIRKLPQRSRSDFLDKLKNAESAEEARELFRLAQQFIERAKVQTRDGVSRFE